MRFIKLLRINLSFIGCLVILFLCLFILIVPFGSNAMAQSLSDHTAELVKGAKKEGKLSFYCTMTVGEADKLLKKFHEKYPFIKVELYRSGSDRMLTKILAEARAEKHFFDVLQSPAITTEIIKSKNLVTKYLSPHRKFYIKDFTDQEGYWISVYNMFNVMVLNTREVSPKEVPKNYQDLLDPKWKGKMGMESGAFYWFAMMLKIMGEEKGLEYMKKLAEQDIQFRSGRTLNCQLVAACEISISIPVYNHRVEAMKAEGAPIEWVALEPIFSTPAPLTISSYAPHPNAARLYSDFLLSREGQEMIASFNRIPSRVDVDAKVPRLKCKGLKVLPFDSNIVDDYNRYIKLFKKVLTKK